MARLIVKRKSEWLNAARNVGIHLDGQKIGTVSNGDAEEFDIPEGDHTLKTKIDWCGSETYSFSVSEGKTHTLKVSAYRYSLFILLVEMALLITHFIVKKMYGINYIILFAIPFFMCSLYYITFGRNRYLVIKEDDQSLSF